MVNNEAQRKYQSALAAVDMSEASANALRVALSTRLMNDREATLVHAFVPLAKRKMTFAGIDQAGIDSYVASERQRAMDELTAFLTEADLDQGRWSFHVEDGRPMVVISRAVSELRPDLLVMGTRGRSAVIKALIGSVAEEALRSFNVDILAVPPPKA
jgi:nucleotide-binding universal stress UspA family protein